jgi:hypothetical protein
MLTNASIIHDIHNYVKKVSTCRYIIYFRTNIYVYVCNINKYLTKLTIEIYAHFVSREQLIVIQRETLDIQGPEWVPRVLKRVQYINT